jgi:catechol 2,3-dioxygenase-like lactoylglutathione lyase family enzyme
VSMRCGLTVFASDLDATRQFYEDALGMTIEPAGDDTFRARLDGVELIVEGGARPRKRPRYWMEEAGVYLSIRTDDFDALQAALTDRGVAFLGDVTTGPDGTRYAGVADPDGLLIEFSGP